LKTQHFPVRAYSPAENRLSEYINFRLVPYWKHFYETQMGILRVIVMR